MWKIKTAILVVCIVGLCAAANTPTKINKTVNNKQKDVKEKRDAVTSAPYSYESPQKSFQTPIHVQPQQQKYTTVEHQQTSQKVAPLEYGKQEEVQQQHIQEPQSQYHPTTFQYTPDFESLYSQSLKQFEETYAQPQIESYSKVPIVHYNGDYDKLNSAIVSIPGYSVKQAPVYSNVKVIPSYVYAAPSSSYYPSSSSYNYPSSASSYNYPSSASYSYPSQSSSSYSYPSQSYVESYAHAPSHQQYSHGFSQSPSALFVPQSISVGGKASKVPDYATGHKGLSHYSSVSSAPIAPAHSYVKTYEVPSYGFSHTQTERPFKPSAYLGPSSSHFTGGDSYIDHSISNVKPTSEYLPPSKSYIPAKEYTQHVSAPAPVEYQIQYVHQQPSKTYLPAKEHQYASHVAPINNNYLPPVKVESPKQSYLPPQAPTKTYLPAKIEKPNNVYLPAKVEKPSSSYLPPSLPTSSYLPPNNPYQSHAQYQSHSSQAAPTGHHQQYQTQQQSHEVYETIEYQTVGGGHSGHKK